MIELDVGFASLICLVIIQVNVSLVLLSVHESTEMLEYARKQEARIVFSDYLINRYGVYDSDCHSIVPQTISSIPDSNFNVSLRKLGEKSLAEGVVVKRLVFLGEVKKENERVLEVW